MESRTIVFVYIYIFFTVRKRSCGKVMFSQAYVKNSVGEVSASVHAGIHTPPWANTPLGRHPPGQTPPPGRHPLVDIPRADPPGRHPPGQTPPPQQTATAADWNAFLLKCNSSSRKEAIRCM